MTHDGDSLDRGAFLRIAAGTTLGLAGLTGLGAEAASGARGAASKGMIGFNQPDSANPVVFVLYRGAQAEAKRLGYTLLQSSANLQATKQIAEIQTWIAEGVKGITVLPLNADSMAPLLKKAQAKGIPFVGYAAPIPGENGFDGWNNIKGASEVGTFAGNWVNSTLGGNAEVALLTADALGAIGARVHLAGSDLQKVAPKAKIVAHQDAITAPQALTVAQSMLSANPNINVFICMSDDGCIGVQQAFMQTKPSAARQAQMCIVGFDGGQRALAAILKGGVIKATAALDLLKIGAAAVSIPVNIIEKNGAPRVSRPDPLLVTHATQALGKQLLARYA